MRCPVYLACGTCGSCPELEHQLHEGHMLVSPWDLGFCWRCTLELPAPHSRWSRWSGPHFDSLVGTSSTGTFVPVARGWGSCNWYFGYAPTRAVSCEEKEALCVCVCVYGGQHASLKAHARIYAVFWVRTNDCSRRCIVVQPVDNVHCRLKDWTLRHRGRLSSHFHEVHGGQCSLLHYR